MERDVSESHDARKHEAAACLQRMFRCRQARVRLHQLVASVFEKFYDANSGLEYYLDKRTGETTWEKPRALINGQEIDLTAIYHGNEETSALALVQNDDMDKNDGTQEPRGFSTQDLALAREQFALFDSDSSGSISLLKLHKLFILFGEELTLANVLELVRAKDTDQSGKVTFGTFIHLLQTQHDKNRYSVSLPLALFFGPQELAKLKHHFLILDTDGSGSIDAQELEKLVSKLGRQPLEFDIPAMVREVDKDQSGTIDFDEFLHIVATMTNKDATISKSSFAALLDLGRKQGLFHGLDDVLQASRQKVYKWFNADHIAEQKRLEIQRERQKRREFDQQQQVAMDRAIYAKHQAQIAAVEQARHAPVQDLEIIVEFQGDGINFPLVGQFARVHYVATFQDTGNVFESTRLRCKSALELCVGVGHTIPGFDLALQRMSIGETAQVTIAPALAYGAKGRPPCIPPNAVLVFRIELIGIKEKLVKTDVAPLTLLQRIRNR